MLTQEKLKSLVDYNPETGIFIWKKSYKIVRAGDIAGTPSDKRGYLRISINKKRYPCHHLAFLYMDGYLPKEVDHIDHNPSNNKWCNLRSVTKQQNMRNKKLHKNNKTGICGVHLRNNGKWHTYIYQSRLKILLGDYVSFLDACAARKSAENHYGFHQNHGAI